MSFAVLKEEKLLFDKLNEFPTVVIMSSFLSVVESLLELFEFPLVFVALFIMLLYFWKCIVAEARAVS